MTVVLLRHCDAIKSIMTSHWTPKRGLCRPQWSVYSGNIQLRIHVHSSQTAKRLFLLWSFVHICYSLIENGGFQHDDVMASDSKSLQSRTFHCLRWTVTEMKSSLETENLGKIQAAKLHILQFMRYAKRCPLRKVLCLFVCVCVFVLFVCCFNKDADCLFPG